jgi:hypothetical protein
METNIIQFRNDIQKVISRFVKEILIKTKDTNITRELVYDAIIEHINSLPFDDIISDIINIIINKANYNEYALICDINAFIKHKNTTLTHDYNIVKTKQDVIDFFKLRMTNYEIVTEPIMKLFVWTRTMRGGIFYTQIHSIVCEHLMFIDIYKMVKKAVEYYG